MPLPQLNVRPERTVSAGTSTVAQRHQHYTANRSVVRR
jgi:hypothetical protein